MKRPIARHHILSLALAAALAGPVSAQSIEAFTVSDIRVEGLQRISAGTVYSYLPVEKGETMTSSQSAAAIRALYKTGFFTDVKLERQGDILVITVKERPAINAVTLIGNKDIKTEELEKGLKNVGIAEGETYNPVNLDRVTQELNRQYNNRGKYNATVVPEVADLDRNRVNVVLKITEGKATKIRDINLVGNEKFTDAELRESWESGTSNWLSWYRRDDQYSREKLSGDLEKLSNFYLDRGYADFNIESTQVAISPDKNDIFLSANLTEGDIYKVSSVRISGDTVLPVEELNKLLLIKEGDTFSRARLEFTSDAITSTLGNIGYAFAKVNPVPDINRDEKTIGINFVVEPGPRVQVPYAKSGIIGAVILGLGRALGETMAVTMLIGNRHEVATSLFAPGYSMAAVIANEFADAAGGPLHESALIYMALLLFGVTVLVNAAARLLIWRVSGGRGRA